MHWTTVLFLFKAIWVFTISGRLGKVLETFAPAEAEDVWLKHEHRNSLTQSLASLHETLSFGWAAMTLPRMEIGVGTRTIPESICHDSLTAANRMEEPVRTALISVSLVWMISNAAMYKRSCARLALLGRLQFARTNDNAWPYIWRTLTWVCWDLRDISHPDI